MAQSASALRTGSWGIRGKVVHGHGRGGSQLGFPTANVELDPTAMEQLGVMENGVFFGWAQVESDDAEVEGRKVFPMVMSVGFNPHFKDKALTAEVHFIHKFAKDFYDQTIRTLVVGLIREQSAFTTLEALIEIIREDCRVAMEQLGTEFAPLQRANYFNEDITKSPTIEVPLNQKSLSSNM